MADTEIRSAHQAASDTSRRLDAALHRAGFDLQPSLVAVARVDGVRVNKVIPPALSLHQAAQLIRIVEGVRQR